MTRRAAITERIDFIDMARCYAMALVFYGHFIEELMLLKNPAGAAQYKFIYSFHMVLFILLAGYVAKERETGWGVRRFLKHRFYARLLPFLFFTLLMMVPPIFFKGKFFGLVLPSVGGYTQSLLNTAFGLPSLCIPSWFLLLIIGIELVHFIAFRFIKASNGRLLIAAILFYVVGYQLNLRLDIFNPLKGRIVGWNYFFIHEAITLYAFYLLGICMRRQGWLMGKVTARFLLPTTLLAFLVVWLTYALNTGPFNFHVYNSVVILFASHGDMLWFPLTALAGCALVLSLAKMMPQCKALSWLGQNTLILMCLNGVFYHYINPGLAEWMMAHFSGSSIMVTFAGAIVTVASLVLCAPMVWVLNTYVPQLVGKPKLNGPLLKRFLSNPPAQPAEVVQR